MIIPRERGGGAFTDKTVAWRHADGDKRTARTVASKPAPVPVPRTLGPQLQRPNRSLSDIPSSSTQTPLASSFLALASPPPPQIHHEAAACIQKAAKYPQHCH